MKYEKTKQRVSKYLFCGLAALLLAACGGDEAEAPPGSSITINPESIEWATAAAGCAGAIDWHFHRTVISVTRPDGDPAVNARVDVTLDHTTETSTHDWNRLYDDPNWTPTVPLVEPAGRVLGAYTTTTDANGIVKLVVGLLVDCPHGGEFTAFSGGAAKNMHLEVEGP